LNINIHFCFGQVCSSVTKVTAIVDVIQRNVLENISRRWGIWAFARDPLSCILA